MGAILLSISLLLLLGGTLEGASTRPNVVLIISDDQAWDDYGFMGHPVIQTPRLDSLANESYLFTRGYVTTSLCRPSLASIATGLYAHHHQITGNDPAIPAGIRANRSRTDPDYLALCETLISKIDRVPTLPRLLQQQGYLCHQSGKWWEGHYRRGGFTHGMTHGDPKSGGRHGDRGLEIGRQGMAPVKEFIDHALKQERPFFVWYAPFLPHTPHNPPERLLERYRQPDRPEALARYFAMCEWFDETCGALVDHIDERGLREKTLIAFVTDNGWRQRSAQSVVPKGWNRRFLPRSKQSPFEGGVRTPIFLRWPGRLKPTRDERSLVANIDLAPTILHACGVSEPPAMDGIDLLALIRGDLTRRSVLFGEIFAHDIANLDSPEDSLLYRWCVGGPREAWKLIRYESGVAGRYASLHPREGPGFLLYDVLQDPHETEDLASSKPDVVESLMQELDGWWPQVR